MKVLATSSLFIAFFTCALPTWGEPPVDLTNMTEKVVKPKDKALTEDNFVFVDPALPDQKNAADIGRMKVSISARSLPGRAGKVLFKLSAGDAVKIAQLSKDKRWQAIYSLKERRKGWVPLNAVILPPPKKPALEAPPSSQE